MTTELTIDVSVDLLYKSKMAHVTKRKRTNIAPKLFGEEEFNIFK